MCIRDWYGFLDSLPDEALIVSVKEELAAQGGTLTFEQLFQQYVAHDPDRWFLEIRIPTLGEARGKLVLLRRFDASAPLGIAAAPGVWSVFVSFVFVGSLVLFVVVFF